MHGRVHCDSYAGVRSLLVPASKRSLPASRRRRGTSLSGIQDAGRWALVKRATDAAGAAAARPAALEHAARTLLRRYGVICWRLLEREAAWLPPWRELVRVYHRLEARGEIRGGRFIAGLSGEQFALPRGDRAVARRCAASARDADWICVSATDPSNLLGTRAAGGQGAAGDRLARALPRRHPGGRPDGRAGRLAASDRPDRRSPGKEPADPRAGRSPSRSGCRRRDFGADATSGVSHIERDVIGRIARLAMRSGSSQLVGPRSRPFTMTRTAPPEPGARRRRMDSRQLHLPASSAWTAMLSPQPVIAGRPMQRGCRPTKAAA